MKNEVRYTDHFTEATLSNMLASKRHDLTMKLKRYVTQRECSAISGIPYGTYVQAETNCIIRGKTRARVIAWLETSLTKATKNMKGII